MSQQALLDVQQWRAIRCPKLGLRAGVEGERLIGRRPWLPADFVTEGTATPLARE